MGIEAIDSEDPFYSFSFVKTIGEGQLGKVSLAVNKKSSKRFAIKEFDKAKILWLKCVRDVFNQLSILKDLQHPFIVNVMLAYQDRFSLYMALQYCAFSDLRYQYAHKKEFNEMQLKFLAAGIVLGLQYLHQNSIIHHDIKPENIVFSKKKYPKITDFGVARYWKPNNSEDSVGSLGYMAPQVLLNKSHGISVDYFSLGVLLYQAIMKVRPYRGNTRAQLKNQILAKQLQLKPEEAKGYSVQICDFISKLIKRKASQRLGNDGPEQVKRHPWLKTVDFRKLLKQQLQSPLQLAQFKYDEKRSTVQVPGEFKTLLKKEEVQIIFEEFNLCRVKL